MDSNPVILDISSDEDVGWGQSDFGGDTCDWLSELLREFDREVDDSDEVTVISEVKSKQRIKPLNAMKSSDKDSDDDCVILDGDPNNTPAVVTDSASGVDDLLIVGEKGQIACRDYPHARSLCVKFPFGSTPHERHCDLCHCYVCDSLAPCVFWGTGISILDHCHATDNDEAWKLKRINSMKGNKAPVPIPTISKVRPSPNFIPQCPPQSNSVAQIQVSRSTAIHSCSSSVNSVTPRITNRGRNPRAGLDSVRNRCQGPNIFRHDRSHSASNLGPRFISSRAICKKAGPVPAPLTNQSSYSSSISTNRVHAIASQNFALHRPVATPCHRTLVNRLDHHPVTSSVMGSYQNSPQPNIGGILGYAVPCVPQVDCQPLPQPNGDQTFIQPGNQTKTVVDPNFPDFNLSCFNDIVQSNQRFTDDPKHQSSVLTAEPSAVAEYNPEVPELLKLDPFDFEFENWLTGNESVSRAAEGMVPSELNASSPNSLPIDPGLFLFDQ